MTELNANQRLLVTAMPRKKRDAEARVNSYSEPIFEHVELLVAFGDVQDMRHWMKEIAGFCLKVNLFAANTTNGHLDPQWVFTQMFTDFAPNPAKLAGRLSIAAESKEYQPRTEYFYNVSHEVYVECEKFYQWLARSLVSKDFDPYLDLYAKLRELVEDTGKVFSRHP